MRFYFRWIVSVVFVLLLVYLFVIYLPASDPEKPRDFGENREELENRQGVQNDANITDESNGNVNYNVHTFYYPWYGNPTFDNGSYYHWNHNIMPGPGQTVVETKIYEPPDEIGSNFYPQLECYSSRDPSVLKQHFEWIRGAGIGTVAVSWYPPAQSTQQGHTWDDLMPSILDTAALENLKIVFHIEPYKDRNVVNLRENVAYIISKYGSHPAFYRYRRNSRDRGKPMFYIYDSYLIPDEEWRTLLRGAGERTIRRSQLDSYFIGLLVQDHQKTTLASAGFDGYYTYFAANGFSYGSTWRNWKTIARSAKRQNMIFIPCVGPGYMDTCVRPWNQQNTHDRGTNGEYYSGAWRAAVDARSAFVGITSFNEWHEGTQIEPAIPKTTPKRTYLDYTPMKPTYYLEMTSDWIRKYDGRPRKKES